VHRALTSAVVNDAIARYLAPRLGAPDLEVRDLWRIPGGASRETWMFTAVWDGGAQRQDFVLRKDPPASLLDTDRETEYAYYSAFRGTAVPVPVMRWLEPDASHLGGPFFVMERIPGGETAPATLQTAAYRPAHRPIAERMYEILAAIATFDWRDSPIAKVAKAPDVGACWARELDHWERIVDQNELSPQPIVRAAIRWLRANPPPRAQRISVVHGDYRVGNVMYTAEGGIVGVLDWEMAHLGDPLEDLAWSMNESWQWSNKDGRPGGIVTVEACCKTWSRASGLAIDPEALRWWRIFCDVKCQGIWLTGTKSFQEGRTRELILPVVSYMLINAQDEALLRSLGRGA
jgi:aminoglycoside phosphotransferase (APT) family kinase protein